jgi:hypothetical protein
MPRIDIEKIRLKTPTPTFTNAQDQNALPRVGKGETFLKGPIPMRWLNHAASLPGKALHVGIIAWFLAGIEGKATIRFSQARLREMGILRNAGYRALDALENAGLVKVERKAGRLPIVTILSGKE